jgi:polysaccharide pyruvyl transferase WcaK-like protein
MSGPVRIALVANGSHLNRGCQAIDLGTLSVVRAALGAPEVVSAPYDNGPVDWGGEQVSVVSPPQEPRRLTPRWLADRLAARAAGPIASAYARHALGYLTEVAASADAVLALGGDNLTLDYGRPDRFWGIDRAVAASGTPLVVWGASIGPFGEGSPYERFAARELGRASAIMARDDLTVGYLRGLGLGDITYRVSDPAFALEPREPRGGLGFSTEGAVGVNLSPLVGVLAGLTPDEWMRRCAALVEAVRAQCGRPVLLVGHVFTARSDDGAFLGGVAGLVSGEAPRVLPRDLDAAELKWAIARMHAFVGARTHATIAAMSSGVPTISVAYSRKARGINRDLLGTEEWVADGAALTPDALTGALDRLEERRDEVVARLAQGAAVARERALRAGTILRDVVLGGGGR